MTRLFGRLFLFAAVFFWATPVFAQSASDAQKRLEEIKASVAQSEERRIAFQKDARLAEEEVEELGVRLVRLGRRLRLLSDEKSRLERRLGDLEDLKAGLVASLATDRDSLVQLIAALERLGRRPAELSLFQPKSALDTARSVGVISTLVPLLNTRSDAIRTDIESLLRVEQGLNEERENLASTEQSLLQGRGDLSGLIEQRKAAQKAAIDAAAAESARLLGLEAEAKDLEALLQDIFSRRPVARPNPPSRPGRQPTSGSASRPPAVAAQSRSGGASTLGEIALLSAQAFRRLKGQLIQPVSGNRTLRFGQRDGALTAKGERLRANAGSEVLAPYDGKIVFSAPFRDYGELLIIQHAEGYHTLLAGLGFRYAETGQVVLAGEPVGAMGTSESSDALNVVTGSVATELYLELREKGQSVDPAPWYKR